MVLNCREGKAYIQFALAKFISLSTVVMEGLCLQVGEAHDSSLLQCELRHLSDEERKNMQNLIFMFPCIVI